MIVVVRKKKDAQQCYNTLYDFPIMIPQRKLGNGLSSQRMCDGMGKEMV